MSNEFKVPNLSGKEAEVLELVLNRPSREMYGLELVGSSEGRLKRGTVYVTLGRMEDKGFLQSRQEKQKPGAIGLPRRLYRVTGYGVRVFQAWEMAKEARRDMLELAEDSL